MHENYTICNCKQVSYNDVLDALQNMKQIDSVMSAFEAVQKVTNCSTGCGGCHDKIMDVISNAMYGYESYKTDDGCKRK